ncbi:MAG: guanylate kinase [Oligoflexales bacterium]|nr:guanylate kinase [Oligoflexales bacterium]
MKNNLVEQKNSAQVFVISAPSGTGKTTLNRRIVASYPAVQIAVSHTTRSKRPTEREGIDYFFVNKTEFEAMIQKGEMLEHALVFGNYYGTSKNSINSLLSREINVILEIDVQGFEQTRLIFPDCTSVFILPPSILDLWRRLENRATDDLNTRWRRLITAREEIKLSGHYQYFIINDNIEKAYDQLVDIVICGGSKGLIAKKNRDHCQLLLNEFDEASWIRDLKEKFK